LNHLTFATNLRTRLRDLRHIFNWEPGNDFREAFYFAGRNGHDDAPYPFMHKSILDSIGMLQENEPNPRLRRAMKWFSNGVATRFYDDQFVYFWLAVELIAQNAKDPTPVPDRCPKCKGALFCEACNDTPTHRPYQKQAIEQLFLKVCNGSPLDGPTFYTQASTARNMLMHGDEVKAIEDVLGIEFGHLVDQMGKLAWTCILNQFVRVLIGKQPMFLQPNRYIYVTMDASVHINIGFKPNFENPDPAGFPKVNVSVEIVEREPEPENNAQNAPRSDASPKPSPSGA
jgi:hypothetical protein